MVSTIIKISESGREKRVYRFIVIGLEIHLDNFVCSRRKSKSGEFHMVAFYDRHMSYYERTSYNNENKSTKVFSFEEVLEEVPDEWRVVAEEARLEIIETFKSKVHVVKKRVT